MSKTNIEFYKDGDGQLKLNVQVDEETVWLTNGQMAELFEKSKGTISEHIKHIFEDGELAKEATVRKSRTVRKEGGREVTRVQEFYNLDVIISVGYRVKSQRGIQFRQWATKTLNQYLLKGYALDKRRLQEQGKDFISLTSLLETSIKKHHFASPEALEMISIIKQYASSFTLLQQYDEGVLSEPSGKKESQEITISFARNLIRDLKQDLIQKHEASSLFGNEKDNSFEAIIGNIEQTFNGEYLYETVEKKAAHLLYFLIKDHPFTDGNKRSAAYLFLAYLAKNSLLYKNNHPTINKSGLVALTLLIAESDPDQKNLMTKLVQNLIV